MTDIYGLISLAGNALLAQQKAISVTGNNIANVNTPGYSRQKLLLETQTPVQSSVGLIGRGVEAVSVDRVYMQDMCHPDLVSGANPEVMGRPLHLKDHHCGQNYK